MSGAPGGDGVDGRNMTYNLTYVPVTAPHMLRRPRTLSTLSRIYETSKPHLLGLRSGHRHTAKLAQHTEPLGVPESHCASCRLFDLQQPVTYHEAWEMQHELVHEMKNDSDTPDALVLLEHEPVYTLGTASKLEHVLFNAEELRRGQAARCDARPMLVRTERGGEVTYHGPGQLVAYPILNLNRHKRDLHWYLRSLEEVVIDMVKRYYGLDAGRKDGLTGVWVGDVKICAMGLKVSKWITMHGLALNVHTDLKAFERIIPCGISEHGVSSLHLLAEESDVCMHEAKKQLMESFCRIFGPYEMAPTSRV